MSVYKVEAGNQLLNRLNELAESITARQYELQPDLLARFGEPGRQRTKQDSVYSLRYLAESLLVNSPALFVHYISWLKILLAGYKVSMEDIAINLNIMKETIEEHMEPPSRSEVLQHLKLGIHQLTLPEPNSSFIRDDNSLLEEAKRYLALLLGSDRRGAGELVMDLVDKKVPLKEIYLSIFQATQLEIGRLWQNGKLSVAQEHFCTSATQTVMAQLYPFLFNGTNNGFTLVAACVGEEQHEVGLRMLTDFFEMEGWNTYYLGANVPSQSLIQSVAKYKADVLAVSATMTFHVHLVQKLIEQVRSNELTKHVKILVGGLPFNIDTNLWKNIGADGYAANAEEAAALSSRLLSASTNSQ